MIYGIEYRAKIVGKTGSQPQLGKFTDLTEAKQAAADNFPEWSHQAAIFAKADRKFSPSKVLTYVYR